jgi:hypothetical protein
MPVVFDEVVGTVIPETTQTSTDEAPSASQTSPPPPLRFQLRHLERRAARLKAD